MPDSTSTSRSVLAQIREILGLGDDVALSLDTIQRYTRRQLVEGARRLGLTGIQSLTKATLASRFFQALESLVASPDAAPPAPVEIRDPARKFDLGQPAERREPDEHIPWGYGQDRITALVVDPDRLYVYWEATDEAISRARADLGRGGPGAWLNLRVYDVTGRLFDGTNAHGYFDDRVARGDRQWFFTIGRPGSSACVELGLRSSEGYFVRIARSGRADFPRRDPAPPGPVEWLTVQAATGEPAASFVHGGAQGPVADEHRGGPPERVGDGHDPETVAAAEPAATDVSALTGTWEALLQTAGDEGEQLAWEGPPTQSEWTTGRLDVPVPPPGVIEEQRTNGVAVYAERGETRVVYSPWQVTIRGLGARAERRVLAIWQMRRSWTTSTAAAEGTPPVPRGASERHAGASEVLGGASETWRLGASELRLRGASEVRLRGASELRLRGASERRLRGASEQRLGGASELRPRGASERARR
jgi:hypothetical protein